MSNGPDRGLLPDAGTLLSAREQIRDLVRHTPLHPSPWLSYGAGVPVHLKLECWQVTHSFKARGALNAVARLSPEVRERGLVAASAGNHGLAVAYAARLHGIPATIFVPSGAPDAKKSRIRRLGTDLRAVEGIYDDAAEAARGFARRNGGHMLHAFADPEVVAGQGTVALEILYDLPEVRTVVVPVGGGGLAAGIGAALRAFAPDVRLLGVQSTATRAMFEAFRAEGVVPVESPPTLCDGLAGETEAAAFGAVRSVMDDLQLAEEADVAPAIRDLFNREGIVAEGSGAVGIAALLAGTLDVEGPVVVVVSGGNIDGATLARILAEA